MILLIIYLVLPLGFTSLYFMGNLYSPLALLEPYNLSMMAGALAYMVFMSQFVMSSRLRFIERFVPQDRLLSLHGLSGMILAGLVLVHFILKYVLVLRYGGVTPQSALGALAVLLYAVLAPLAILVLRGRKPRKGGSPPYEKNRKRHNLFALAGLFVVVHVLLASSTWSWPLRITTLAWGLFSLGAYVWHKMIRPRQAVSLVLSDVSPLASDVHRYRFESEGDHKALTERVSGQFGYFSFESDICGRESHPFTVAAPAGGDPEIVVRSDGDFTRGLTGVPVGTPVRFDGPYGHFTPASLEGGTPVAFIAGGIGITPFLSAVMDENVRRSHPMTLHWSIRSPKDELVAAPLRELADSGEITMKVVYTRNAPEGHVAGRLSRASLEEIRQSVSSPEELTWFICGPSDFTSAMKENLLAMGVKRRRIRSERFSW